jgi:xanthine dehydrogenase D subunit
VSRSAVGSQPPVSVPVERPRIERGHGVGASPERPDARLKVKGEFAFSSDLWAEGMLWGVTLRSPHPHARIRGIDLSGALSTPGVNAVLTHEDVPGENSYGLERPDQPVLAGDVVRYQGEPVAIVAADHPEAARRAAQRIGVDYELLEPVTDPEAAIAGTAAPIHPGGNVLRHLHVRHGDMEAARAEADVVLTGEYELGMQDQAFLGPESGLAIPAEDGGVDLYVATQWLHADRRQVARSLGMPEDSVRITLAGVGGAFGGREDLSMHVHACMLALHTRRPVKMVYSREESFFGHVHRHPAWMRFEHGASADGRLVYVAARIVLDGGAYASSSPAVCLNAASTGAGPYEVPNADIDCYVTYTNNPPCGAMRGFGAVQVCFGYEAMMDRLAAEVGVSPVEIRRRNAMATGTVMPTGQVVDGPAPVADLLARVEAMPLPPESADSDLRGLPGGVSNTTHGEGVRRGVGYAVGFKNVGFSGGFDDYSTARVRMAVAAGEPLVEVHTACAEVGQGGVTVHAQIARTELGVDRVTVLPADTQVGNAGSSSASRQTWLTGGAVKAACDAMRERLLQMAVERLDRIGEPLVLRDGHVATAGGEPVIALADLLSAGAVEETREYRPRPTSPIDPDTGQGDVHMAFAFAAHRAVVDVDVELGLVKVVEIATAQDVGRAMNPVAVQGQIDGGIAQGLGLALMEEIQVADGLVRNPSFTDYLIPTILDMPPVRREILELAQPHAPYGLNGVGEPPTISSTPALVAALRQATGQPLTRVPVQPDAIAGVEAAHA